MKPFIYMVYVLCVVVSGCKATAQQEKSRERPKQKQCVRTEMKPVVRPMTCLGSPGIALGGGLYQCYEAVCVEWK